MNKRLFIIFILIVAAVFRLGALNFKMSSLLPEGTEWDRALKEMAEEWREATDGRIRIRIYPGGIAGGEADIIRKMRIGQIDMAVLSSIGITAILPDTFAMSMPFMLETEDELDFIVKEVTPIFNESFLEKGFIVLAWSKSGWVKFFSKDRIIDPEDMMEMKFAGPITQPELADSFKKMGFNVIPVDLPDTLMALQSGMVDSMYASPMMAASYQWFGIADNMLDLKVSPVLGGVVISEKAWKKIPEKYREELLRITEHTADSFYNEAVRIENNAIETMMNNGLVINKPEEDTLNRWEKLVDDKYSAIVGSGGFVSEKRYNEVASMLEEFRSR